MMNVSRRAANGEVDPNDKMNKSQISKIVCKHLYQ